MNLENYKRVLAQIEAQPETWDQWSWHTPAWRSPCGTAHCFAGWSEIFATGADPAKMDGDAWTHANICTTKERAIEYLGITTAQANWLFRTDRTLDDFRRVAETGICPEDD